MSRTSGFWNKIKIKNTQIIKKIIIIIMIKKLWSKYIKNKWKVTKLRRQTTNLKEEKKNKWGNKNLKLRQK